MSYKSTIIKYFNDLKITANATVGDYNNYTLFPKDENLLANKYIEAKEVGNKRLQDAYISILMLRHWKDGANLYNRTKQVKTEADREDFIQTLYERIEYACKYARWKKDPKVNAQQCIRQAITTEVKNIYYFSNLDKNKANFGTLSFETSLGGGAGGGKCGEVHIQDLLVSTNDPAAVHSLTADTKLQYEDPVVSDGSDLVQFFVNRNKIVEAIILDNIANNDVFKHTKKRYKSNVSGTYVKPTITAAKAPKKRVEISTEFWPHKLVKVLSDLPSTYYLYFTKRYKVNPEAARVALSSITKSSNTKLYKYVRATLTTAKQDLESSLIGE